MGMRCLLLLGASYLLALEQPVAFGLSWKSIILFLGGGFLLFKAVREIHHVVEGSHEDAAVGALSTTFGSAIAQIILLGMVFSIDSVITAVGLTDSLGVIHAAVVELLQLRFMHNSSISGDVPGIFLTEESQPSPPPGRRTPGLGGYSDSKGVVRGKRGTVTIYDGWIHINPQ